VAGSFLLGVILRGSLQTPAISPELRAMLTIGFCGGFTTFSTFSYETATLLEDGQWGKAALYVGGSVVLSIAAIFLGFAAARELVAVSARG
jgi:CrcB protein